MAALHRCSDHNQQFPALTSARARGYDPEINWGRIPMKASVLSFRAAVLMVVAGMIWGIVMGISQDHSTFPAHAHLNLLGWASLFLFGIYTPTHR